MTRPYVDADVRFMTDMIHHHAQAVEMSRIAPYRDASPAVRRLAERIISAQIDEIVQMQQWLADRQKPFPRIDFVRGMTHSMRDHSGHGAGTMHEGHGAPGDHGAAGGHPMMIGMLTPAQMAELDAARGRDFDRLFLRYMIQHHSGAVAMVSRLFATPGAGQNNSVFKLASDVNVDQTTEIARMEQMLANMQP